MGKVISETDNEKGANEGTAESMKRQPKVQFFKTYYSLPNKAQREIQRDLGYKQGVIRILAEVINPSCAIARADGKIVGWAIFVKAGQWYRSPKRNQFQLFVRPEYRRKGVGTFLLDKLMTGARLRRGTRVGWQATTKAADRFFKTSGLLEPVKKTVPLKTTERSRARK